MRIFRLLLFPFSILYFFITEIRNLLFAVKILRPSKFDLPVISVGNLSTGGTGKSPQVEYLLQLLKTNYKMATLSRGFGRKTAGYLEVKTDSKSFESGDEPLQFKKNNPEVVVGVDSNRVRGLLHLLHDHPETEVVLLDDAYQHRAIQPGFSILLTDYNSPFFMDFLLPAGNLREIRRNARRADLIVVTKCPETIEPEMNDFYLGAIARYSNAPVFHSRIRYGKLKNCRNTNETIGAEGKDILLVTGIANPEPLENYLKTKAKSVRSISYPDHHRFSAKDIEKIARVFSSFGDENKLIVSTEKDIMRLLSLSDKEIAPLKNIPVFYQEITTEIEQQEKFNALIHEFISTNKRDPQLHPVENENQS